MFQRIMVKISKSANLNLSLAGRLVVVKHILVALPVYLDGVNDSYGPPIGNLVDLEVPSSGK